MGMGPCPRAFLTHRLTAWHLPGHWKAMPAGGALGVGSWLLELLLHQPGKRGDEEPVRNVCVSVAVALSTERRAVQGAEAQPCPLLQAARGSDEAPRVESMSGATGLGHTPGASRSDCVAPGQACGLAQPVEVRGSGQRRHLPHAGPASTRPGFTFLEPLGKECSFPESIAYDQAMPEGGAVCKGRSPLGL